MTATQVNTASGTHQVTRAILLEAAERVIGKEHSRDDLVPGSFPFDFELRGRVGTREVAESYAGTLNVDPDGIATPTTPYKEIAGMLLAKMNEATRAACLLAVAAGEFAADNSVVAAFDAACKQFRERQRAENPKTKHGDVKPIYAPAPKLADLPAEPAPEPAAEPAAKPATAHTRKPRKAV